MFFRFCNGLFGYVENDAIRAGTVSFMTNKRGFSVLDPFFFTGFGTNSIIQNKRFRMMANGPACILVAFSVIGMDKGEPTFGQCLDFLCAVFGD